MALADLKKRNAAKLEEKRIEELRAEGKYVGPPKLQDHEKASFPTRKEFEVPLDLQCMALKLKGHY